MLDLVILRRLQGGEVDAGGDVVRPILAHGLEVTQVGVAGVIGQQQSGIFTAPMDHNYRNNGGGSNGSRSGGRGRPGFGPSYIPPDPEPLPKSNGDASSRIFAFVDDLFFAAKIQETARKLNVKVEFVKSRK